MKPYPTYKDSGLPWLGAIPDHWEVRPTFVVLRERQVSNAGLRETRNLSLSYGRIVVKDINSNFGLLPASFETYQIVEPGNIILRFTDLQNDHTSLRVGLVRNDGIISSAYLCLSVSRSLLPEYAYQQLHAMDTQKLFYSMGGGLRQSVGYDDLRRMPFLIPPPAEQSAIVAYLDRKTADIQRFITKKRQLIALLNEQKAAIINRAVTKGLNPDAPMKDSGVEWLGEVPAHWEVRRLKYVSTIVAGQSPHESTYNDTGIGTILINGPVEYSEETFGYTRSLKWTTDPKKMVPKDTLLFCMRGSTTGRLNITHAEVSIGRGVSGIIASDSPDYLRFVLIALSTQVQHTFKGSTFPSITSEELGNYMVASPLTTDEKKAIISHIQAETEKIVAATERTEREIELIQEYRTTLISDVVTGKIDVREAAR